VHRRREPEAERGDPARAQAADVQVDVVLLHRQVHPGGQQELGPEQVGSGVEQLADVRPADGQLERVRAQRLRDHVHGEPRVAENRP
jgi:hypothetical protein